MWKDDIVATRDRAFTITPQCNAAEGNASVLFARLRPQIEAAFEEAIKDLPSGYEMEWGGEFENSMLAKESLASSIPITLFLMVLIVIALFNAFRQPLIIWLTVPMAIIGVTFGLLFTGQPFGFMALLGLLSLIGMLIKNAIVLVDETDMQIREGKPRLTAVLDSGVSRLRPVSMAALTTVLGMIPLLADAFFIAMAVTIMAGLAFATVLTLLVVPTLYSIFFVIRNDEV